MAHLEYRQNADGTHNFRASVYAAGVRHRISETSHDRAFAERQASAKAAMYDEGGAKVTVAQLAWLWLHEYLPTQSGATASAHRSSYQSDTGLHQIDGWLVSELDGRRAELIALFEGLGPSRLWARLNALSSILRYGRSLGLVPDVILPGLFSGRNTTGPRADLRVEDLAMLQLTLEARGDMDGLRAAVLVGLSWQAGVRAPNPFLSVRAADYDREARTLAVPRLRADGVADVAIPESLHGLLCELGDLDPGWLLGNGRVNQRAMSNKSISAWRIRVLDPALELVERATGREVIPRGRPLTVLAQAFSPATDTAKVLAGAERTLGLTVA